MYVAQVGLGGWDAGQDTRQRKVVLRLGSQVRLGMINSLPERYRARASQLAGRLNIVFLQPTTAEAWCRLSGGLGGQIWPPSIKRVEARTLPLNEKQPSTPPPDAIDLRHHTPIDCQRSYIGRLEGVVIESVTGLAQALLVHIRADVAEIISGYGDPMRSLLPHAGQSLMVPPDWARAKGEVTQGATHRLRMEATIQQIAHGLVLRGDDELLQDVWTILRQNPAVAPYITEFRIIVQDGTVTIAGAPLSPRLHASVEQDIWHIPGVLDIRNLL